MSEFYLNFVQILRKICGTKRLRPLQDAYWIINSRICLVRSFSQRLSWSLTISTVTRNSLQNYPDARWNYDNLRECAVWISLLPHYLQWLCRKSDTARTMGSESRTLAYCHLMNSTAHTGSFFHSCVSTSILPMGGQQRYKGNLFNWRNRDRDD